MEGGLLEHLIDVGEVVALCQNISTRADLEGVTRVLVPVVVHGVQVGVLLDLGGTTTGLVQVVTLEGHLVAGTIQVDIPVVVAITSGRPVRFTVDVVVGDGDPVVRLGAEDVVLATDTGSLDDMLISFSQNHIR